MTGLAALAGGALVVAGCLEDSVYSSGGDAATERTAQAVVMRNLVALERGEPR